MIELPCNFIALNPRSLAHIERNIEMLAGLTNRAAAATKLISKMRRAFAKPASNVPRSAHQPVVYCEAWPNPRISSPTWVAELVEFAGAKFALPPGQRVTDEQVAVAKPDLIILAWTATSDRADPQRAYNNSAWKNVPAVQNRRVIVVKDELLNTPGPPLIEGARQLFKAIQSVRHK